MCALWVCLTSVCRHQQLVDRKHGLIPHAVAAACTAVAAAFTCAEGAHMCHACPIGTSSEARSASCTPCPLGYFADVEVGGCRAGWGWEGIQHHWTL